MVAALKKRIRLHPAQAAFRQSDALYRGFVGGIGSGKSWAGAYDLLRRAKPGRLYMVAAPTYPMLRDATLRTFCSIARDELRYLVRFSKSEMTARLGNGAEVLFRSADDPERLRGPNLSGLWLDEASLMTREAYDVTIGRLREAGEQGWLSATFTPKGRSHWTYEVFGRNPPAPNTHLFHAPTKSNPFLPSGFEATLREQYAGLLADQELGGLFVDVAGAEWPSTYFGESLWFHDWPANPVATAMALDPSKGKSDKVGDYSAFVVGSLDAKGHLYIDADLARRPTPKIVEDGLRLFTRYQPQAFAVEINQFQELLAREFLRVGRERKLSLPLYGIVNTAPKPVRVRTVGPYLARQEIHFLAGSPGAALLVEQLREFPEGAHDDGPDALEMLLRMLRYLLGQRGGPGQPEIVRV